MKRAEWRVTATGWLMLGLLVGGTGCSDGGQASQEPALGARSSRLDEGPDLVITAMRVPPSLRPNPFPSSATVTASVTVCNQGTDASPQTQAQLYVSMDDELTPMGPGGPGYPVTDQSPLGMVQVPDLFPGRCATVSTTVWPTLPPDAQNMDGAYYVGAIVDEQSSIQELNEDNNIFVHGLIGVGDGPDLVITAMNVSPSLRTHSSPSSSQTASVTVCNQGTQDSWSTQAHLYLSMDDELTPTMGSPGPGAPVTDQSPLGMVQVPDLFPGRCATVSTNIWPSLPPDAQNMNGAYYVGAIIDEQASIQELREDNNVFIHGLVGVGSGPDLVITAMNVPSSLRTNSSWPSSTQTVGVTVCNHGTQDSPPTQAQLYLSMDEVLTPMGPGAPVTDQSPLGLVQVPDLFPGRCATVSTNIWPSLPPDAQNMDGAYYVGAIVDAQASIQELREDNNAFIHGLVGVGDGPDLVITAISLPPSLRTNSSSSSQKAGVTVCNHGTDSSPQTQAQLYLSMDKELTAMMGPSSPGYPVTDQSPLGLVQVPDLFPGRCATVSTTLWPSWPPDAQNMNGAYYVGAIIDEQASIHELREDNNVFVHGLVGVGVGPDLVITAMSVPPSLRPNSSWPSSSVTASVTVCNHGTQDSWSTQAQLYLSMDKELTAMTGPSSPGYPVRDQSPLGMVQVPDLFPGRCATVSTNIWPSLPPDAQNLSGTYHVGAIIDEQSSIQELREDNNTFIHGLVGVGVGPDLVITAMSVPPSLRTNSSWPSSSQRADVTVCNHGTQDSPPTQAQLYLSMDKELTAMMGPSSPGYPVRDQSPMGLVQVPDLFPGRCATVSTNIWPALPPDAQNMDGAYYVGAIVDAQASIQELREDNNAFIHGLVGVGDGPDLVITALSLPPSLRTNSSSSSQRADVTVCNHGTDSSPQTQAQLYLSMDKELTAMMGPSSPGYPVTDQSPLGMVQVPDLFPGRCATVSTNIWPSWPPDAQNMNGAYYVGAIIDEQSSIQELREDNNIFVHGLVGVGEGPDLVITAMSVPPSLRPNSSWPSSSVTASVTVCNQGTQDSWSTQAQLYLSMDKELTAMTGPSSPGYPVRDQSPLGMVQVPDLFPGRCATVSTNIWPSLPPDAQNLSGTYYVGAIIDEQSSVQELREDNNTFIHGLVGVGVGPDLVITAISLPPSLRTNSSSSSQKAGVTVCNHGTQDSPPTQAQLYLSMDKELTAMMGPSSPGYPVRDQSPMGLVQVPDLFPGHCATVSTNIWPSWPPDAQSMDGAYYVGAIIDEQASIQELREDNNIFVHGLVGVGDGPDLVITAISLPPSLRTNSSSSSQKAGVTVCNHGTDSSPQTQAQLYLSMDKELTAMMGPSSPGYPVTDQSPMGLVQVPDLFPGHCATVSTNIWPSWPPDAQNMNGAYYVGAIIDEQASIQELREDNNIFVHGLVGVGDGADLVITAMSVPPSLRTHSFPPSSQTASVTVCNHGTQESWSTQAQLYLSVDKELTAMMGPSSPGYPVRDQSPMGMVQVPDLFPGRCATVSTNIWVSLPPDAQNLSGAYYVGAIIDEQSSIQELREDNNTFVHGLVGVGDGSDLVITAMSIPTSVAPGQTFTLSARACNQGTLPSGPTEAQLYLSIDTTLSPLWASPSFPVRDQTLLGQVSVSALAPGQCEAVSTTATATLPPDAQGDGAYYIGAVIDGASWEHELREDNNVFVKGLIGIGNRPDLVIRELSAPASVAPGQPLAVTVKTCNQGNQSSSPALVQIFLSLDDALSSPSIGYPVRDQMELTGTSLPPLGAGQCLTQVLSGPAMLPPDAQGDGRYFLGAIIDDSNQVHELREDNNTFAKTTIGVGLRSDLVVTALTSAPSVQMGASFSATVQVCNQGTQPSSASSVFLYTSLNAVLTAESPLSGGPNHQDQHLIGVAMVGAMNPGGCFSQSLTVSADLPPRAMGMPGAYFLGAYADAEESLPELREDNNSRVTGLLLTP